MAWRGWRTNAVHERLAINLPSHNEKERRCGGDSDAKRKLVALIEPPLPPAGEGWVKGVPLNICCLPGTFHVQQCPESDKLQSLLLAQNE